MKKIQELWNSLNGKRDEINRLREEGKSVEAHALLEDVKNLKREIELEQDIEDAAQAHLGSGNGLTDFSDPENHKQEVNVAFNRAVLGKNLTEEQAALVEKTGEDGGYLVPVEQKTTILELKRQSVSLKEFTNVIKVTTKTGSLPTEIEANDRLIKFSEMEEINQSTIKFGQGKWDVEDYGDIIPVSNTLLQDESASLMTFIGKRFAKKAVRTENDEILARVKTAEVLAGDSWKAIRVALNKKLDPIFKSIAIVVTNQDGFDYLDSLEDKNGRPLLKESLSDPDVYLFKGRQIVVLSDAEFPSVYGKKLYKVGSFYDAVNFYDRDVYEVAISKEAGFTKNATFLRAIERFDTKTSDIKAIVNVEITLTPEEEAKLAAGITLPLENQLKEVNTNALGETRKKALLKMSKEDLMTMAEQFDIELPTNATKDMIADMIEAAEQQ